MTSPTSQRYWYKGKGFRGNFANTETARAATNHPVMMRVAPSVSLVGNVRLYNAGAAPSMTSASAATVSTQHADIYATSTGMGAAAGQPAQVLIDSNESAYIALNARL